MKHSSSIALTLGAIVGLIMAGQSAFAQYTIFSDNFSSSTLNSATPAAPTATSTAYQYVSGKSDSVTPSISSGDLSFGISSTSSGTAEVQALFTGSPVSLAVGDYLTLNVVFTDTAGILTGNGLLGIGMYNSGGVGPIAGGLDAGLSSSATQNGGTLGWQGYVGQLGYTGLQNSRIMDRQTQTANYTRDQDLVASGSSSQSYHDPSGSSVGSSSVSSTLSLTAGQQYTDVLTYMLTGSGLQIDNNIYSGNGASGTPLWTTTGTGITPLTSSFDGLAVGWIERGSETTTMDINSLSVVSSVAPVPEPASMALLGLGAVGMLIGYRRRRR